ncbi:MAG: DUF1641 domain-containing protein [Planctomycetes bacterium]|nr:DUF1641 domain-containing protein [Planctomycetota bacterium]
MTDDATRADEAILAGLRRIEERLERLEQQGGRTEHIVAEVPGTLATAVDAVDGTIARLQARGVDVDERGRRLLALLESLSAPAMLDQLEAALRTVATLPATLATLADTLDNAVARLGAAGIDVDERLNILALVAERLTAPEALAMVREFLSNVESIHALLQSGILEPAAVTVVGRAAGALTEMDLAGVKPVGAFGALRALGNPCIRRSLGALVAFGKAFGRTVHLKDGAAPGPGCPA